MVVLLERRTPDGTPGVGLNRVGLGGRRQTLGCSPLGTGGIVELITSGDW